MRFLAQVCLFLVLFFGSLWVMPEVQVRPIGSFGSDSIIEQGPEKGVLTQQINRQKCLSISGEIGLERCRQVLTQDRDDFKVWNRIGRLFFELEDYDRAYLSFMYATHLRADYAVAWANMCAALSQLQSYEKALNACNASLKVSFLAQGTIDEKVLALNNKAIALYLLGRYQESLETSEQALVLKPDDSQATMNREFTLHALAHETDKHGVKSIT